jgi:transposase
MKTIIKLYDDIVTKVKFFSKQLKLKLSKSTGRPLKVKADNVIALSIFKQGCGIQTKKSVWKIFNLEPICTYKTLVVNMNRLSVYALLVIKSILDWNRKNSHLVKHTDSTDIPVCLNKNAKNHKTMKGLADWGYSGKGWYYGLKLHLTQDLERKVLSFSLTPATSSEREQFKKINKDLDGIFVADAGYTSEKLEKEFYKEHKRILFAKPRKNMKKIQTLIQAKLYDTRMLIELNFRNLKMFCNLVTSLPRSIDGYFANYIYSILASVLG